jgi:hypothetical protein
MGRAYGASPADGLTGVAYNRVLSWNAGPTALSHDVYFGTDEDAVRNADTGSPEYAGNRPSGTESFYPGPMDFGRWYYWRIDEVTGDGVIEGGVWSFETSDFLLLDDFESYVDKPDLISSWDEVGGAWVELSSLRTGPTINYHEYHGGAQSMRIEYWNAFGFLFSEACHTFSQPQDWTASDLSSIELYFLGSADNDPERM